MTALGVTIKHNLPANQVHLWFLEQAVLVASSAEHMRELIRHLIGRATAGNARALPTVPSLDSWLRMYRQHRKMFDEVGWLWGMPDDVTLSEISDELVQIGPDSAAEVEQELRAMSEDEQVVIARLFSVVEFPPKRECLEYLLAFYEADSTPTEDESDPFEDALQTAGSQFYFRVWLPCWILYKTYPQLLLRQARLGDDDALDKLLRLDKSIVADSVIAQQWHKRMHDSAEAVRSRFTLAMRDGPKGRLDAKSMRIMLVGLISQMAKTCGYRITTPQIGKLFDMIAQIRDGKLVDPELPVGDALSKAAQRNRNWPSI